MHQKDACRVKRNDEYNRCEQLLMFYRLCAYQWTSHQPQTDPENSDASVPGTETSTAKL